MSYVKVDFDDEFMALLILCWLLESWNGLFMAISNSVSGSNTLKFDDVVGVILSEEMRQKSRGETSGNALNMENRMLVTKYQYSIEKPQNKYLTPWKRDKFR